MTVPHDRSDYRKFRRCFWSAGSRAEPGTGIIPFAGSLGSHLGRRGVAPRRITPTHRAKSAMPRQRITQAYQSTFTVSAGEDARPGCEAGQTKPARILVCGGLIHGGLIHSGASGAFARSFSIRGSSIR